MNSIFSRAALLLLLLAGLPATVRAQYNYITNNGSITINQYTGPGGNLVIPDTINGLKVTSIGSAAFFQVQGLTNLTFGTNVALIGTNAVFQCYNLAGVVLPASVTNIGPGPFFDCLGLTSMAFSSSNANFVVTNNILFNRALTSLIQFPGGVPGSYTVATAVTNIGAAFVGNSLTTIAVSTTNTIYSSTNGVLYDKNKTELINYPGALPGSFAVPTNNALTTIISAAFEYSQGLTSVTIGTNINNIGLAAFYDCTNLTSITVNATNKFYSSTNGVLYDKNKTFLIQYPSGLPGSYVIPNTVSNIGEGAFGDAFGLTSVVIPNFVTNISFESFYACLGLTSVTLGSGIKNIDQDAFFYCPLLDNLVFPAGVTNIGFEAFSNCGSLSSVCFEGKPPTDGGSIFYFDNSLFTILYVNGATGWGPFYDGLPTESCATCGETLPTLAIAVLGTNALLGWPDTFPTFTLQSSTNLNLPASWGTVSPSPSDISGEYIVTNPITAKQKFYRLIQ